MKLSLFLIIILAISCDRTTEIYEVAGTVHSVNLNTQKAVISHDTIPNLMMPMVMPFFIQDEKDLIKIQIGDSVHFCLLYTSPSPRDRH